MPHRHTSVRSGETVWRSPEEAAGGALAALGGAGGLALGVAIAQLLTVFVPGLPVSTPWWFALLAEGVAIAIGLAAGVLPARRAAAMEPV